MAENQPSSQPLPQDAAAMEADIQATLARMGEANQAGAARHAEWVDRNLGGPVAGVPGQEDWPKQYGRQVHGQGTEAVDPAAQQEQPGVVADERSAAELEADLNQHMADFREQNRVEGARTKEMLDEAGPQTAYDIAFANASIGGASAEDAHRAGVRAQDDEHGRRGNQWRIPDHDGRFNEYGDRLVASGERLADFHWGDEVTPIAELDAEARQGGGRHRAAGEGGDGPEASGGSTSGPKVEGDDKKPGDPAPGAAPASPTSGTTYGGEGVDAARQQIEERAIGRARVRTQGP